MKPTNSAKMFLASERGCTETDFFRSYYTFNFGAHELPHKKAIGSLYVLNDDTLAGGKSLEFTTDEPTTVFLLPVIGSVCYQDTNGYDKRIEAGQLLHSFIEPGGSYTITNPFDNELVNFLQVWIKTKSPQPASISSFNTSEKNSLQTIAFVNDTRLLLGKYDGRQEGSYQPKMASDLFVFVIDGAFEVQNRLLETKDGLALSGVESIEFEALSNEAIILLIEIPYSS